MGGYWGPSYYFYINKVKDGYQFRYGYDKDGRIINNTIIGINLYKSFHDEEYYDSFISKLLELTHEWKEEYYDSDIMDGMQWDIHFWQLNKTYAGSNNFPQNYKEVMDYVKESENSIRRLRIPQSEEFLTYRSLDLVQMIWELAEMYGMAMKSLRELSAYKKLLKSFSENTACKKAMEHLKLEQLPDKKHKLMVAVLKRRMYVVSICACGLFYKVFASKKRI